MKNAKKAGDKDWDALISIMGAGDLSSVRRKTDAKAEAIRSGRTVHFGSLMGEFLDHFGVKFSLKIVVEAP